MCKRRNTAKLSLANAFGVSIDYLENGSLEQKAQDTLDDNELLQQFKEVEQMDEDDRGTIKKLIDAFITKRKVQKLAHKKTAIIDGYISYS